MISVVHYKNVLNLSPGMRASVGGVSASITAMIPSKKVKT